MSTVTGVSSPSAQAVTTAPFFVVGCGRSGSTLLRMMLVSHSRLSIPPETWYLIPLLRRFPIDRPLDADEVARAVAIMTTHYRWPDMRLDAGELRAELSRIEQPYLRDLAEVVYRWHMHAEGKARWGDKTPVYIEIVPELARLFPDARFIHLVRDGRDVAKSYLATDWIGRWLHDNTREWTRALELEQRWSGSDLRQRILQVRYEDLVLETEAVLRAVCGFIGEEFEPRMLSWQGQVDEQVPARERDAHGKLKQRIGPEGVARWQREMSTREQFVCEAFMGAHLTRMGYQRRFTGTLWAPLFAVTRLYCRTVLPAVELQLRAVRFFRNRLGARLGSKG
ncbi:MAG TPA: sulfotransferase [Steroidobacteraceae bacterium]|nr:sulfotransferase [Steroidobacteraceae bacterium]